MYLRILTLTFLLATQSASAKTIWESADTLRNVNLIGFAHVDFGQYNDRAVSKEIAEFDEGFQEARVALHLSSRLSSRITTFAEAEVTATSDDVDGSLERYVVKYDIDNSSQFSIGRYHAPVGYWNQYYHHGRWLQLSKDRPVQSEFGLGFVPAHYRGVMYERKIRMGGSTIEIDLGLGGGRDDEIVIPAFSGPVSIEGDEALVIQVNVVPDSNRNLTYGGSAWIGDLNSSDGAEYSEEIITAHLKYAGVVSEFIAEVSSVKHNDKNGRLDSNNYGAYLQYSHRLAVMEGRLRPYIRIDYLDIDRNDFIFSGLQSKERQTLGVRYDITDNAAVKLELRRDELKQDNISVDGVHGQIAAFF